MTKKKRFSDCLIEFNSKFTFTKEYLFFMK